MKQPHCRYCGAKLRKATTTIFFVEKLSDFHNRENARENYSTRYVVGHPTTKAEAQRLLNQPIVSVRHTSDPWAHKPEDVYVAQVSTWDGESYADEFFCNGKHAQAFAYVMARAGQATRAYNNAIQQDA